MEHGAHQPAGQADGPGAEDTEASGAVGLVGRGGAGAEEDQTMRKMTKKTILAELMAKPVEKSQPLPDDVLQRQLPHYAELCAARERAKAAFGGWVVVKYVEMDDGRKGFIYGVTVPMDRPFWRGFFADAVAKVDELVARETSR